MVNPSLSFRLLVRLVWCILLLAIDGLHVATQALPPAPLPFSETVMSTYVCIPLSCLGRYAFACMPANLSLLRLLPRSYAWRLLFCSPPSAMLNTVFASIRVVPVCASLFFFLAVYIYKALQCLLLCMARLIASYMYLLPTVSSYML